MTTIADISTRSRELRVADFEDRQAYRAAQGALRDEAAEILANEYASNLTPAQQATVFSKAWADGHAGGFEEVENSYIDTMEFVDAFTAV